MSSARVQSTRSRFVRFVGVLLAAAGGTSTVYAGSIATDVQIQSVANTQGNQTQFSIVVTGGSGPCSGQTINFPVWAAVDADSHKRAYAATLMAFAMGAKVSIWNYVDNGCLAAAYIVVTKN